jgi:glycosyltransferase involved in cell wall biosynthesis
MFRNSKIVFDNLGYHYHHKVYFYQDQYFCSPFWVTYINELSSRARILTIFCQLVAVEDKDKISSYKVFSDNVKIVHIGNLDCRFVDKFKLIKVVQAFVKSYLRTCKIDQMIFEVPSFFSIYIYKYFKRNSVFFIVGDMVRCIKIEKRNSNIFNIKLLVLQFYYMYDKLMISFYSNKEISFGGTYRGFFRGKHVDQYSFVRNNCEAHAPSYGQNDVVKKVYMLEQKTCYKLLTVFRLSPEKDINSIIYCARLLMKNGLNFKWSVLGDGPSRISFQNLIDSAGLSEKIILCGNVEHSIEFTNILIESDFYILPNRDTGVSVGRSGWEMMARGLVCIFPPLAQRRHFQHKINCLITQNGSAEEYSHLILYLANNPQKVQKISLNASQTAFDYAVEPSVDHIVNQILYTVR